MKRIHTVIGELDQLMVDIQINRYLEYLWRILSMGNKAIDTAKPWVRMKEGKEAEVQALLCFIANLLAKVALLLHPIMPEITLKMGRSLKITLDAASFKTYVTEGQLLADFTIERVSLLFPKIEAPLIAEASGGLSIAAP
ncbi:class I tRNA ligase family protein [Acidithiobacillus thiooxidans]|uniref:class I tRNA ligase family protein n=1 Tax=Acidithiobacillus thiooxidans TaxID=930 RepID=UPI0031F51663